MGERPHHDLGLPTALTTELHDRIRANETAVGRIGDAPDTLWDHTLRVAALTEKLGRSEGLVPSLCRLAGLFHDAGKFADGHYHHDQRPEELRSVAVLRELGARHALDQDHVDAAAEAIEQLYRDDPDPTPLACVLFDADNLDKLGPLGIASFFVKAGLRGRSVSPALLHRVTVELTYARHAPTSLWSASGRRLARERAPATVQYFHDLLQQLRDDGLADFRIEEVMYDGLVLDVAAPVACSCGGPLVRAVWQVAGIKCNEIHVEHACASCGDRVEIRFCRPRLS